MAEERPSRPSSAAAKKSPSTAKKARAATAPASEASADGQEHDQRSFTVRYGALEIDIPRSLGFFGAIGAAVALEMIDPPLALFIAAVPIFKMLDLPRLPLPANFFGHILEGAAKPVGSDADGVIRINGESDR